MGPYTVFSFLGTTLDRARTEVKRWGKWRPNIALCQHKELPIKKLVLLHPPSALPLLELVCRDIAIVSPTTTIEPVPLAVNDPWEFEEVFSALLDLSSTYPFDDKEEYLLHMTTGTHVAQICLFLLAEARYFPGKLIQTAPLEHDESKKGSYRIIDLDLSRYDTIAQRFSLKKREKLSLLKSGIETKNEDFNRLIEQIEFVATNSPDPILLTGATGTGKSHLARQIYQVKRSHNKVLGPLVEVNCATLRGDSAMSSLFGHTKGAFTGAATSRAGLLLSAHKGVLFLDEIGELGLDEQAMLLRALEEKRFLPMGADREVTSDFQLIAGTNRDLRQCVREKSFREDLLARIDLWSFHLPSLRERREDIEPNLEYELSKISGRLGMKVSFSTEARLLFLSFAHKADWHANFRQFNASITRMGTLSAHGRITESIVRDEIQRIERQKGDKQESTEKLILPPHITDSLDPFDRVQLEEVVNVCLRSSSLSEAGRALFSVSRGKKKVSNDADRLRKYLARFGLTWDRLRSGISVTLSTIDMTKQEEETPLES